MLTDGFVTDFIHREKGALRGDCFSPLMFNLIINTFIHSVKHEQYEQFGYKFVRYLTPRHWYQFADDAAVISGLESENQMLSYQRYVLSKLSWNLTIADIDITWVKQSLERIFNKYVRSWLESPIADSLDIIQLSKRTFGICYVMVSTRFTQRQTVIRNNLRKSSNNDVVTIYYDTNCDTNSQHDQFKSTKEVLTQYQKNKQDRITIALTTQSLVIKSI